MTDRTLTEPSEIDIPDLKAWLLAYGDTCSVNADNALALISKIDSLQSQLDAANSLIRTYRESTAPEYAVERATVEVLGWAIADACHMMDEGIDIRKVDVQTILTRIQKDLMGTPVTRRIT